MLLPAMTQEGHLHVETSVLGEELTRIDASNRWSRWLGMTASAYLFGDILIDTTFSLAGGLMSRLLADRRIAAIACTHSHEDHAGNCGTLSVQHDCPVFLRNPAKRWEEGVGHLALYRRFGWGRPAPYAPREMPGILTSGRRSLRAIPTPGHSDTHVTLFEESSGTAFTGDLYISGGASAVMKHENPYASVQSLRSVAGLEPRRMLNGHGLVMENPSDSLREKANRIEEAAGHVLELHDRGVGDGQILLRVFRKGRLQEWLRVALTGGEFSRRNFIRACIAHRPG